ncbi:DUF3899 domain-containing protein [Enterococcus florum]|uniref:DUF3899 domain-containing protein n=1 Tax=Enterococcus florum TaxID=2480627 RepID=UPI0011BA54C1|nr:DUF3899 domain-containing protein [Enterococcus florum]
MRIKTSTWIISGICAAANCLWLLVRQRFSLLNLSNNLFLTALFFVIIGMLLWIFSTGFFDRFQASLRHIFRRASADAAPLSEASAGSASFWLQPAVLLLIATFVVYGLSLV